MTTDDDDFWSRVAETVVPLFFVAYRAGLVRSGETILLAELLRRVMAKIGDDE